MSNERAGQPWLVADRDPGRIPGVLKRLEVVWKKYPSMRLGQLIGNVFYTTDPVSCQQYFVEDEEFIKAIENYYERLGKGNQYKTEDSECGPRLE